ncbi:hypothetical protein D9V41_10950 [Aeromicrobium phragmitis]|uniref:Uncharacterized protein n=1 Tax=Aeromicrobium phragmitis TaxID=2478914 RepID=A0A3L8PK77_9ACTN|nr:hypothetical protein D9V41_10950 [Aeromicrobium phragmitis]
MRGAVVNDHRVDFTIADDPGRPATMDYAPTTSTVVLDELPSDDAPLTLVLGDLGTVEIDRRAPGEFVWATR